MAFVSRRLGLRFFSTRKLPTLFESGEENGKIKVQLFAWGKGASGQLGNGSEEIHMYPCPVANLFFPASPSQTMSLSPTSGRRPLDQEQSSEVVQVGISCGLFHSGLVVDGQLWIWGKGDGGRLGLGNEHTAFRPTRLVLPDSQRIRSIALGGLHSTALTSSGRVFTWGYGGFGALGHCGYDNEMIPRLVEGPLEDEICHVTASGAHTAAVTISGELYTWGRDEGEGRLGIRRVRGPMDGGEWGIPCKVKALPVPIAAASCGGFFTSALTNEGKIWNWGANGNYELGRGDKVGGWEPKPLPGLEGVRIIQIACGAYHTLALTDDGKVLSWGFGGHGQLGHSTIESERTPRLIDSLSSERVGFISCGGSSSAAITDEGKLYMWGNSKFHQLGLPGVGDVVNAPKEVQFLEEEDDSGICKVISVSVGSSHTICLLTRSGF